MKTIYKPIAEFGGDESQGTSFQTHPLQPGDEFPLARAVCYLLDGFIPKSEYSFWVRKGSLTLQRELDNSDVLKVFFDDDSLLPVSRGRSLVIGFELTGKKPEVREGWRDMLARIFRQGYIDPRVASQTKYYLQPNTMGHFYDLAVLDADFVFEAKDTDLLNRLNYIIKQAIEDEAEDVKVDWE